MRPARPTPHYHGALILRSSLVLSWNTLFNAHLELAAANQSSAMIRGCCWRFECRPAARLGGAAPQLFQLLRRCSVLKGELARCYQVTCIQTGRTAADRGRRMHRAVRLAIKGSRRLRASLQAWHTSQTLGGQRQLSLFGCLWWPGIFVDLCCFAFKYKQSFTKVLGMLREAEISSHLGRLSLPSFLDPSQPPMILCESLLP